MLKNTSGFSMVELAIVLSIVAILATVGAPSLKEFLNSTRFSSASLQVVSDLNLARSEAIKRNNRVLMCIKNSDGTGCGTGTDWKFGWVVCTAETDTTCAASATTNPNPLIVRAALANGLTLSGSSGLICFKPNGSQCSTTPVTLTLGGSWTGATPRVVTVAGTGSTTTSQ